MTLVEEHLGLVYTAAQALRRRVPAAEIDELVSAGTLGLLEAAAKFDPARGLAFSTHAVPRIRGAMLDELRRQGGVPRGARHRQRRIQDAIEQLGQALGRPPRAREVAARLEISLEVYWRWLANIPQLEALEEEVVDEQSIEEPAPADERRGRLEAAIARLSPQQQRIVRLFYFEERSVKQIAAVLQCTQNNVFQLRSHALGRLRRLLEGARAELAA